MMIEKTYVKVSLLLFFLSISFLSFGQESYKVTGQVLGSDKKPIEGVSVSVEGSAESPAVTDEEGFFEVTAGSGNSWLIITPLGNYEGKRIFVNGRNNITVYINEKNIKSSHDEVLYPGVDKNRRNLISAVSTLDDRDLQFASYATLDQYFQGRIPGLHVNGHSGMPGTGGAVFIRGINSFNSNSQPLYVIDGMPLEFGGTYGSIIAGNAFNPVNFLEPLDITRISVIKDGLGKSKYGLKGSNGIILVETLKPTETQTTIDFAFNTGFNFKGKELPQLNSREYKTLANEILSTTAINEEMFPELYPGLFYSSEDDEYIRYSHDYNWQKEIFTNSTRQDAYISVRGGDAVGRYGLSVGYRKHEGIYKNTSFQRFTTRFVGTFNIFEWLRMYVSANLANTDADLKESALLPQGNPVLTALFKSPLMFPYKYDQNDNQLPVIDDIDELGVSNPTAVMENYQANNSGNRFLTSIRIEGDISEKINWNSILGLNIANIREYTFLPNIGMDLYYSGEVYNASKSLNNGFRSIYNNNYLSYSDVINNVHNFSAVAGTRLQINKLQEDWAIAKNANENDQYTNLSSGIPYLRDDGGNILNWNWMSGYGIINYGFRDKYLAEMNVSVDMSSNIGREAPDIITIGNVPYNIFYGAGAAWRLSSENFLKNISVIEDLKLRISYGVAGNDDIGVGNIYNYYRLALYRESSGVVPSAFSNTTLTSEKIREMNAGIDLSLLASRFRFKFDYYKINSDKLLVYEELNPYIGYSFYPVNNGAVKSSGLEAGIYAGIINGSDFKFDIDINLSKYRNEISSITGGKVVTDIEGGQIVNSTGNPVNSFYGYIYDGVFSTTEEALEANMVNARGLSYGAGDAIFRDVSGPDDMPDGIIDDYDKVILGSATPDYFGGLSTNFRYKRWGLVVLWQFSYGNDAFNYIRYQNEKMTDISNQSVVTLDRWEYEGQVTDVPRAVWADPVENNAFSSRWIEDASWLRLKQLTLSYTIPENFLFFRNIGGYATATNLWTFTNYLGYDPEFSYSFRSKEQGVDYGLMPFYTSVVVGIRFGL